MYADRVTPSMKVAIDETDRRRKIQALYNQEHGVTPRTVARAIMDLTGSIYEADYVDLTRKNADKVVKKAGIRDPGDFLSTIEKMKKEMHAAADDLDFERAAALRDKIKELQSLELALR
jgi:excinuclease ABC subunit B